MQYNPKYWPILLLLIRIWLCYAMIRNGNSVIGIFNNENERIFFRKWFGEELHFPAPLLMAALAKGSEFIGGILLGLGLFTRLSASFVAFTMFVATVTANLNKENFNIDGGFTISYMLFALIFVVWGAGIYSLDYLIGRRRNHTPQPAG
jgi:uncharacterized membrane protein YphA (DoxX/SURF4 family)